jgi:hypothetical protein
LNPSDSFCVGAKPGELREDQETSRSALHTLKTMYLSEYGRESCETASAIF